MTERFIIRPDHGGSDCDLCTREPAVIAITSQTNLSHEGTNGRPAEPSRPTQGRKAMPLKPE